MVGKSTIMPCVMILATTDSKFWRFGVVWWRGEERRVEGYHFHSPPHDHCQLRSTDPQFDHMSLLIEFNNFVTALFNDIYIEMNETNEISEKKEKRNTRSLSLESRAKHKTQNT